QSHGRCRGSFFLLPRRQRAAGRVRACAPERSALTARWVNGCWFTAEARRARRSLTERRSVRGTILLPEQTCHLRSAVLTRTAGIGNNACGRMTSASGLTRSSGLTCPSWMTHAVLFFKQKTAYEVFT